MTTETIHATAIIVHNGGSEEVSNFAHLEEVLANGTTDIHVWYDEHTGDPDTIYENASITSITHSRTGHTVDNFDPNQPSECPLCGGNELSVLEIEENIYKITPSGEPIHVERGPTDGPVLNVYCTDCHAYLYQHALNGTLTLD